MNKKVLLFIALLAVLTITLAYVIITRRSTSPTMLYVNPQIIQGTIGQEFTINISISNVPDLYGWSFKLRWNTTILEAVKVTESTFLRNGGDTFFVPRINNSAGYATVDCTLLGNIPGVSGNDILATIQFRVKEGGTSDLILYDTMLIDSTEQLIVHTVINGHFKSAQ